MQAVDTINAIAKHCTRKCMNLKKARKLFDAIYYADCMVAENGHITHAAKRAGISREHLGEHIRYFVKEGTTKYEKQRNEQK